MPSELPPLTSVETTEPQERIRMLEAQLAERNQTIVELTAERDRYKEIATKDSLTGLFNRAGFQETLKYLIPPGAVEAEQRREGKDKPIAILILDFDNFKIVNDAYGHFPGDRVLVDGAQALRKAIRQKDIVGRWGGEEFIVAFPNATAQDIINKFYDPARGVAAFAFETQLEEKPVTITMSGGVTELLPGETIEQASERADKQGLYRAKEEGKNRILKV